MNTQEHLAVFAEWKKEPPQEVVVKGKTFYVRELSTREMDKRIAANGAVAWQKEVPITIGAMAVMCEKDGSLVLDPNNEEHVNAVGDVQWSRIQKITNALKIEEDTQTGN